MSEGYEVPTAAGDCSGCECVRYVFYVWNEGIEKTRVVVVVFTLKTVLTSTLQGKETNLRGHKLAQKNNEKNTNKDPEKVPTLATEI